MDDLKPCLAVNHGGIWVEEEEMYYRGGRVNVFDDIPDIVDSSYVKQLIDSLGYTDILKLHFLDPRKTMKDGSGQGSFMSLLNGDGVGCYEPRINRDVKYDYDSEGTDEDDVEFVSARDRLTQEIKNELDYEEELGMLKSVAESKGKGVNMFEDDWEGVSDEDSPK
uniref:Uncharacterized protein n=1 Tax=Chenopodium quinoa TaxID=63459 RepID=A0A803MWD1_CHEQI